MRTGQVKVNINPQTGCLRQAEVTIGRVEHRVPIHEVSYPGLVEGVEMLLDQKIRHTGRQLQANRCSHRPATLVWRNPAAMGQRQVGNRQRIADAAERHRLWLKNIHAAACGQGVELANGVVHLARGDPDRALPGHRIGRLLALAGGGLFPPVQIEWCEFARRPQGVDLGEPGVYINQDAQPRPKALTQCQNNVVGQLQLIVFDKTLGSTEGIELERIEPHGHHWLGRRYKVLWRALGAVPAVGISRYCFANLTTQQLVNRHTQ